MYRISTNGPNVARNSNVSRQVWEGRTFSIEYYTLRGGGFYSIIGNGTELCVRNSAGIDDVMPITKRLIDSTWFPRTSYSQSVTGVGSQFHSSSLPFDCLFIGCRLLRAYPIGGGVQTNFVIRNYEKRNDFKTSVKVIIAYITRIWCSLYYNNIQSVRKVSLQFQKFHSDFHSAQ